MSKLPAATRDWLAGPGLTRLWEVVRKRLESNGVQATGSLRLTSVSTQERNDLALLLGKPVTRADVTVRLDALDTRLRASAAGLGLRDVLEELGPPLTDRRAVRAGIAARREQVWSRSPRRWTLSARRTGLDRAVVRPAAPHRRTERSHTRNSGTHASAGSAGPHRTARPERVAPEAEENSPPWRPGPHTAWTTAPGSHASSNEASLSPTAPSFPATRPAGAHFGGWCLSHRTRSPAQC